MAQRDSTYKTVILTDNPHERYEGWCTASTHEGVTVYNTSRWYWHLKVNGEIVLGGQATTRRGVRKQMRRHAIQRGKEVRAG